MPRSDDEALFKRILATAPNGPGITERSMFGGRCILVNGNMSIGTWHRNLVVRLDREKYQAYLGSHTRNRLL